VSEPRFGLYLLSQRCRQSSSLRAAYRCFLIDGRRRPFLTPTRCPKAEFRSIRERLIKIGVRVIEHLAAHPHSSADELSPASFVPRYCARLNACGLRDGDGVPEVGGYSVRDAQVMIRSLQGKRLIGADICEVAPMLDPTGQTALNAANLLFEMDCVIGDSRAHWVP
jgi:hypothetical protein